MQMDMIRKLRVKALDRPYLAPQAADETTVRASCSNNGAGACARGWHRLMGGFVKREGLVRERFGMGWFFILTELAGNLAFDMRKWPQR